jgi:hypothetical protein
MKAEIEEREEVKNNYGAVPSARSVPGLYSDTPDCNKVLSTTGKFPRCTPVRELHVTFKVLYIYVHIMVII